jgi:outer membrane protein OmpA-like peptidoglycan-associated protein
MCNFNISEWNIIAHKMAWQKIKVMKKSLLIVWALLLSTICVMGQNEQPPMIYVDSTGQVYTRADAPAYFFVAPADNESSLTLIPSADKVANPMKWDGQGTHYLVHKDLKKNMNIRFRVIADGAPPRSSIKFNSGLLFRINNNYFAEVGSSISITARDIMSGVKDIQLSINNQPFSPYTQAFSFDKEGEYTIKVFATDNVGNTEKTQEFVVQTTSSATVRMDNIYFDINSTKLRPEAIEELNKLTALLKEFSKIHLEIRAHTDSRGNAKYNLELSDSRAKAAVDYLISKGIPKSRLSYKGYGDTMLLNECLRGADCPEEKHSINRRVEFIVSKMQ